MKRKMKPTPLAVLLLAALGSTSVCAAPVVTVYSADGLHDGNNSWYQSQFDAFTQQTGIKVQYVEGGSGAIVERLAKERTNPQADVLVTVPPVYPTRCQNRITGKIHTRVCGKHS